MRIWEIEEYFPVIFNHQPIAGIKELMNMATKTLDQRIVKTPDICGGKPRIDGHRITLQNIVIPRGAAGLMA